MDPSISATTVSHHLPLIFTVVWLRLRHPLRQQLLRNPLDQQLLPPSFPARFSVELPNLVGAQPSGIRQILTCFRAPCRPPLATVPNLKASVCQRSTSPTIGLCFLINVESILFQQDRVSQSSNSQAGDYLPSESMQKMAPGSPAQKKMEGWTFTITLTPAHLLLVLSVAVNVALGVLWANQ